MEPKCFVAYASAIPGAGDAIESAIEEIKNGSIVSIRSWRDLAITGTLVIDTICEEIRNSDIFIADVTLLNPNVLFELGYAIARRKKIYLLYDPNLSKASIDFEQFGMLTTIGSARYANSDDIVRAFYRDEPYLLEREKLFDQLSRSSSQRSATDRLLYIKPETVTEPAKRITRRINSGLIPPLVDESEDIRFQSASWYLSAVINSFGVVCHFLSNDHKLSKLNNAKTSFVAGLAYGLEKPLLMLAHEPYSSPIDYRDLLRVHHDANAAVSIYDAWALPLVRRYAETEKQRSAYKEQRKSHANLLDIYLGEPIAEHEMQLVEDYFVETSAYRESLVSNFSIFVGRRGSGKTATLFKISAELQADPRNHVCTILPAGFELSGIADLFKEETRDSPYRGYILDGFWKFLAYTELAKSIYEKIQNRPAYHAKTREEEVLCLFIALNQSVIMPEFATRLENAIESLQRIDRDVPDRRIKISEVLHDGMLGDLRRMLGEVLKDNNQVAILVDNLDKSWTPGSDLQINSEVLLGLMSVGPRIAEEFHRSASGRKPVRLKMIVFVRSDIYGTVFRVAREKDKLPTKKINWDDPELLLRVIEERFLSTGIEVASRSEIWEKFFLPTYKGIPTPNYLVGAIVPRPRDIIVLVKACIESAINRGNPKVDESDIKNGVKQYANFAFNAMVVEGSPQIGHLEDILIGFMDLSAIVTEYQILGIVEAFDPGCDIEDLIRLLTELNFLGFETGVGEFEFLYGSEVDAQAISRATKVAAIHGERRFKIHPVFEKFLGLKGAEEDSQMNIPL